MKIKSALVAGVFAAICIAGLQAEDWPEGYEEVTAVETSSFTLMMNGWPEFIYEDWLNGARHIGEKTAVLGTLAAVEKDDTGFHHTILTLETLTSIRKPGKIGPFTRGPIIIWTNALINAELGKNVIVFAMFLDIRQLSAGDIVPVFRGDAYIDFEQYLDSASPEIHKLDSSAIPSGSASSQRTREAKTDVERIDAKFAELEDAKRQELIAEGWKEEAALSEIELELFPENISMADFLAIIDLNQIILGKEVDYDAAVNVLVCTYRTDIGSFAFTFRLLNGKWIVRKLEVDGERPAIGSEAAYGFCILLEQFVGDAMAAIAEKLR